MKFKTLILALGVGSIGAGLVPAVHAQQDDEGFHPEGSELHGRRHGPGFGPDGQHRRGPGRGFGHGGGAGGLERLDEDGDGFIDETEFLAPRLAHIDRFFDRLDRDDDGLLSPEELEKPERSDAAESDRDAIFECIGATIENFELPLDLAERFDTMDTNDDSAVDADELEAALTQDALERFAQLDGEKDGDEDGVLDEDEISAAQQQALALRQASRDCIDELRSSSAGD